MAKAIELYTRYVKLPDEGYLFNKEKALLVLDKKNKPDVSNNGSAIYFTAGKEFSRIDGELFYCQEKIDEVG